MGGGARGREALMAFGEGLKAGNVRHQASLVFGAGNRAYQISTSCFVVAFFVVFDDNSSSSSRSKD